VWKKSSPLRILVVDDESLIRWSLVETDSAVPFDVALLDFRLPDSNDLTLLSRLRRLTPATRIILMTAFGTPEMSQEALDRGAYCVLHKPFEMNALSPLVNEAHATRF
jgi:DNA-binding NtrC family response regulator